MVTRDHNKKLIVEGISDLHAVCGLMSKHVNWPEEQTGWPVFIKIAGGIDNLLDRDYLTTELKAAKTDILGVVIDADADPQGRYRSLYNLCHPIFQKLPSSMPTDGVIVRGERQKLGIWIMPDNAKSGDIELFLAGLIPESRVELWNHATSSVSQARSLGASFKRQHIDKANLYTWLAWGDPPQQSPKTALMRNELDPFAPGTDSFVSWFKNLFEL